MTNYYTADLHLSHEKARDFRGFTSTDVMNRTIIDRVNQRGILPQDILYVVGDVAFGMEKLATLELLREIQCKKVLIKGNHDNPLICNWDGWESVHDYLEVKEGKKKVILFHYPIEDWNSKHYGVVHFHGHEHANLPPSRQRIDVGIDNRLWNFSPVTYEQAISYMQTLPEEAYTGHHRPENAKK